MPAPARAHHGLAVRDLEAVTAAVAAIGFTDVEGGGAPPRRSRNEPGDAVGQLIAPLLGDEIRTWTVANPATGQELDLVELTAAATRVERPGASPAQGDLTIGIACADPDAAWRALRGTAPDLAFPAAGADGDDGIAFTLDGQACALTRGEPFARVHYTRAGFAAAWRFLGKTLGYRLSPLSTDGDGDERWALAGGGGRVELAVEEGTPVAPPEAGKRYPGSNHFRLLNADLAAIAGRVEAGGAGRWLFPPDGSGFAQIIGPCGELIELYDRAASGA